MSRHVSFTLSSAIARGEGATLEFKRSLTKDVGRELCAFANAGGGTTVSVQAEQRPSEIIESLRRAVGA